jgi:C4-type Zn-finger protein
MMPNEIFEADLFCPICKKEIHFENANNELTNKELRCPHCNKDIEMDSSDDDGDFYFWLTPKK